MNKVIDLWYPIVCKLCSSKASWARDGSGDSYCSQCKEDVAFK